MCFIFNLAKDSTDILESDKKFISDIQGCLDFLLNCL